MAEFLHLPILASEHGAKIDQMIVLLHILIVVLFVGWSAFFIYCLVRFRKKKNPAADPVGVKTHASSYIEAIVVILEIVLLVGFSIPFWVTQVDALPDPEADPFELRIIAQQFAWNIHYPGMDGVFGRTSLDLVDDVENPVGLDRTDPNAADDVTSVGVIRLPVDRQVLIHLSSKDVIHSFSLPEFRVKQDAIPGMTIPLHFTPTLSSQGLQEKTGDNTRNYEIVCAQLCGLGHYTMSGLVFVLPEEDVNSWIESRASRN